MPLISAGFSYFNSQPHEEADLEPDAEREWSEYFNSQPHEEADVKEAFIW